MVLFAVKETDNQSGLLANQTSPHWTTTPQSGIIPFLTVKNYKRPKTLRPFQVLCKR